MLNSLITGVDLRQMDFHKDTYGLRVQTLPISSQLAADKFWSNATWQSKWSCNWAINSIDWLIDWLFLRVGSPSHSTGYPLLCLPYSASNNLFGSEPFDSLLHFVYHARYGGHLAIFKKNCKWWIQTDQWPMDKLIK